MSFINYSQLDKKINKLTKNTINKNAKKITAKVISSISKDLIQCINDAIQSSADLTTAEKDKLLSVPLKLTNKIKTQVNNKNGSEIFISLGFEFVGDRTMPSIEPGKHVYNLVALFNNGYPTNNITPGRPLIGYINGRKYIISAGSKRGAHFIGRGVQMFLDKCAVSYPDVEIRVNIGYEYSLSA